MPPAFDVDVRSGVVVLTLRGLLQFDQTAQALAAAAEVAKRASSRKALFDVRLADLSNYYSYAVRHADAAPELGLDLKTFRLALLGTPAACDVLSFIETICRNRGWTAKYFTDWDAALRWLQAENPEQA